MSFRLIIEWPNGSWSQSRPSPVESRAELGLHAFRFICEQVPGTSIRDGKKLGCRVRDAALGEVIAHEPSGYRFCTKEF